MRAATIFAGLATLHVCRGECVGAAANTTGPAADVRSDDVAHSQPGCDSRDSGAVRRFDRSHRVRREGARGARCERDEPRAAHRRRRRRNQEGAARNRRRAGRGVPVRRSRQRREDRESRRADARPESADSDSGAQDRRHDGVNAITGATAAASHSSVSSTRCWRWRAGTQPRISRYASTPPPRTPPPSFPTGLTLASESPREVSPRVIHAGVAARLRADRVSTDSARDLYARDQTTLLARQVRGVLVDAFQSARDAATRDRAERVSELGAPTKLSVAPKRTPSPTQAAMLQKRDEGRAQLFVENRVRDEVALAAAAPRRRYCGGRRPRSPLEQSSRLRFARKRRPASTQNRSQSAISRSHSSTPRSSIRLCVRAITHAVANRSIAMFASRSSMSWLSTIFSRWRITIAGRSRRRDRRRASRRYSLCFLSRSWSSMSSVDV